VYGSRGNHTVMGGNGALHSVTPESQRLRVAAVGCSALPQARLRDALRNYAALTFVDNARQFERTARDDMRPPNIIVIGGDPATVLETHRQIRDAFGVHLAIGFVAYLEVGRGAPPNLGALAVAGFHQLVFVGFHDDTLALRAIFEAVQQQSAAEVVLRAIQADVPETLHPMLEAALNRPRKINNVRQLADALGVTRKTLFKRCERANFLNPADLLLWTRLVLVAHMLDSTGCTVETLANELGFASPNALRNAIKRHTKRRALELRKYGALKTVAELFARHARIR
jgi:AraC-like DNA-binding protein